MSVLIYYFLSVIIILLCTTKLMLFSSYIALSMTIYMFGDDFSNLYVDGTMELIASFPTVASKVISAASSLLAIKVYNSVDRLSTLVSLTVGGCITNTVSWRCTDVLYPNWNQINYDDVSWPLAVSVIQNIDLSGGPRSQFSLNCPALTFGDSRPVGDVYCRHWLN